MTILKTDVIIQTKHFYFYISLWSSHSIYSNLIKSILVFEVLEISNAFIKSCGDSEIVRCPRTQKGG